MKLNIMLIFFLMGYALFGQNDPPENQALRVMTFNIRYDNSQDGKFAWVHRKNNVVKMLDFHKIDIAGLQEVLKNQLDDLRKGAPQFASIGVGRRDGREKGEFAPIFFRRNRFQLIDWGTFWLSETPADTGSIGWDAALERIATWALFRDRRTARTFYFYNSHFDHRGETARRESVKLIKLKIHQASAKAAVILCGDFNLEENSAIYHEIGQGETALVDTRHVAAVAYGPAGTFTGFDLKPGRLKTIDFIFVDKNWQVLQQGILSENWNGILPSDHRPVIADIEFR